MIDFLGGMVLTLAAVCIGFLIGAVWATRGDRGERPGGGGESRPVAPDEPPVEEWLREWRRELYR